MALPLLLGLAAAGLAAPSILEKGLDIGEGMGYDPLGRRARLSKSLESGYRMNALDFLDRAGLEQQNENERGAISGARKAGSPNPFLGPQAKAVQDFLLTERVKTDYGAELSRIARQTGPSFQEIAARLGLGTGGMPPG